jgi:hypothetical protein
MSAPHLYHRLVPLEELSAAVGSLAEDLEYLYVESEADIALLRYDRDVTLEWIWPLGRAFGERIEVRWQPQGAGYELLLLSETERQLPEGWRPLEEGEDVPCLPDAVQESQMVLWGTLQEGSSPPVWTETRIPKALEYPVDEDHDHVVATVKVYVQRGRPVLTRLVRVKGSDDEPRPL